MVLVPSVVSLGMPVRVGRRRAWGSPMQRHKGRSVDVPARTGLWVRVLDLRLRVEITGARMSSGSSVEGVGRMQRPPWLAATVCTSCAATIHPPTKKDSPNSRATVPDEGNMLLEEHCKPYHLTPHAPGLLRLAGGCAPCIGMARQPTRMIGGTGSPLVPYHQSSAAYGTSLSRRPWRHRRSGLLHPSRHGQWH